MKNFKKIIAIIMVTAMVVACFAGCGEENGTSGDTFFIGATGPLTGSVMSYGVSVKNGAQLAVEEINAAGGLDGINFTFEMLDDKATAEDAATGYDQLFDKGMNLSLGSVTSGSCEAFATKAAKDKLFFITPSASAANVIENRPTAFRVCFGDPDQGILAADELSKTYTKIGAIYDSSDDYSSGIYAAFESEMKKLGKAYTVQSFDKENNRDFSTQVEALKDCEVIFLPIYYTEAGLIAKACVSKGVNALLFGCDGLDGVAGQIDSTVTNTIKYITPFDVNSTEEKTANFVKSYTAKYNTAPDQFAADGYDAIYTIFEALKAAGVKDTKLEAAEMSEKIIAALTAETFSYKGVTGGMTWDASCACTKVPVIVELGK
ncbi:MAG: ABC transporter substrate-binding protein [Clostridiales bacterium]|nr:ABC transporter substrate-binding protein [Candidatus Equinaster intestinalis]